MKETNQTRTPAELDAAASLRKNRQTAAANLRNARRLTRSIHADRREAGRDALARYNVSLAATDVAFGNPDRAADMTAAADALAANYADPATAAALGPELVASLTARVTILRRLAETAPY